MKKSLIAIAIITLMCLVLIPNYAQASMEWNSIKGDADSFIGVGLGNKQSLNASNIVYNIAGILTTIGIIIVLGGILILGIKYMTAKPDEAAKLKTKLVGLAIAGVVVIAAFGIWKLIGNYLQNMTGTVEPITIEIPEDTPTPTPTTTQKPTPTPTPEITEADQGDMKFDSSFNSWVYIPHIEDIKTYKNMPVIIYLHGGTGTATQRGVIGDSLPKFLYDKELKVNALILCPLNDGVDVKALINQVKSRYSIDEKRISITGHSTGAYYAIYKAKTTPGFFSACVPMSLRYIGSQYWVKDLDCAAKFVFEQYHGYEQARQIAEAVKSNVNKLNNPNISWVQTTGTNHGTVTNYYKTSDIMTWMISQSR